MKTFKEIREATFMITVRKAGPGGKDLNVKVKGRDKNDAVKQWRMKNKKYKNDEVEVSESNTILDEKTVTVIADYDGYGSSNTGYFMKKYKIKIKTMRGGEAKISGKVKDIRKFLDSDDYDQGDADDVADANPQLRETDASWAKSLEKIQKQRQLDKISDKDKETLMKIAALLGKEKKRR